MLNTGSLINTRCICRISITNTIKIKKNSEKSFQEPKFSVWEICWKTLCCLSFEEDIWWLECWLEYLDFWIGFSTEFSRKTSASSVEDKWSDGNPRFVPDDLLWRPDLDDWSCRLDLKDLSWWSVVVKWSCRLAFEDKRLLFEGFL